MSMRCDEFVSNVERLVSAPASLTLQDKEDILAFGTRIMRSAMVPMLQGVNQEYFTVKHEAISVKKGQTAYRLPIRSIGGKIRLIQVSDGAGGIFDMRYTQLDRGALYSSEQQPYSFYFLGDRVELTTSPDQDDEYTIIIHYPASPGKLVMPSKAGLIDGFTDSTVSCTTLPTSFTGGRRYDFVRGSGSGWYAGLLAKSTGVSGTTVYFDEGAVPETLEEGDFLALTGESPVIQLPPDIIPYMETKTAEMYLGSLSDFEGKARLQENILEQKNDALSIITPRSDGQPRLLVNSSSRLRGRRSRNMGILWRD